MQLPNGLYDKLKWIIMIACPAVITLISTLGTIYGWDTTLITATIGACTTFVGALIGISTSNYSKDKGDGNVK